MSKKYIFIRDGKKELVELERWAWAVVYNTGEVLKQFGDDGVFHQIGEINQENVNVIYFYKPANGEKEMINIIFPTGGRIIHKYKRYRFDIGTPKERYETIYVFGYKLGKHYHYNYIMPDDKIVQSADDDIEASLSKII